MQDLLPPLGIIFKLEGFIKGTRDILFLGVLEVSFKGNLTPWERSLASKSRPTVAGEYQDEEGQSSCSLAF